MIRFEWFNTLTESLVESLKKFYYSFPLVHIEQYPGWDIIEGNGEVVRYCIATEDRQLKGYVMVREHKKIEARIIHGPLCKNADEAIEIILEVIRYYKTKNYLSLQVLLGIGAGMEATYLQYSLFKKNRFSWHFDKFNKGTLLLKLSGKSNEALFKSFSESHRQSIKKSVANNLVCKVLQSSGEIDAFADGYYQMLGRRRMRSSAEKCKRTIAAIYDWLQTGKIGFFMGVFEKAQMIGGVLILYRGEMAECYYFFSLPDKRKQPINHLTFYEAIKRVKQEGIPYFDFGGYFIFVKENDQVFHINQFKKGFHGEYFFYPPIMYFDLKPLGTSIIRFLKKVKEKIRHQLH